MPAALSKPVEAKSRIVISHNGKLVATGGTNSAVRLFQVDPGTLLHSFVGQRGAVTALALSRDGTQIASGNPAGELRFWNVESSGGQDEFQRSRTNDDSAMPLADGQAIRSLAFNRDRSLLAAAADDGGIWVVHLPVVGPTDIVTQPEAVQAVAFADDESVIATAAEESGVKVWDAKSGQIVHSLSLPAKQAAKTLAWSPKTAMLTAGTTSGAVTLWELNDKSGPHVWAGHQGPVASLGFLADGKSVVSAGEDGRLIFWRPPTSAIVVANIKVKGTTRAMALSADGDWLLVAPGKHPAQIFDRKTGKAVRALSGPVDNMRALALSREADLAAAGDVNGKLTFWKASNGSNLAQIEAHRGVIHKVAFSPGGRRCISAGGDGELRLWEAGTSLRVLAGAEREASRLVAAPNGKFLVTCAGDGPLQVLDADDGKPLRSFAGHGADVTALAISPESRLIASGDESGSVRIWKADGASDGFELLSGAQGLTQLTFDSTGKHLLAATAGGDIFQWPAPFAAPREVRMKSKKGTCLATSGDGKLLAVGATDACIQVLNAQDGSVVREFSVKGPALTLALNSDGRFVAWGSNDGRVECAPVAEGDSLFQAQVHQQPVRVLQFSPDSRSLASGDDAGQLCFWKLPRAPQAVEPVRAAEATATIGALAVSGDGTLAVSGDTQGQIALWSAQSGKKLQRFGVPGNAVNSLAFGSDGATILSLTRDHRVRTWKPSGGAALDDQLLPEAAGPGVLRPDGTAIVYPAASDSMLIWDPVTRKALQRVSDAPSPTALRFSGAGELAWLDPSGIVQIRSVPGSVFSAHPGPITQAAYLGTQILTVAEDGATKLWTRGGLISRELLAGGTESRLLTMSSSGQWAAVRTAAATLSLLRLPNGDPLHTIEFPTDVRLVAAAPDGCKLAVCGADRRLRIYDPRSGALLDDMPTPAEERSLAFTATGAGVLASGMDGKFRLYQSTLVRAWKGHAQGALDVVFRPDGSVISGGSDKRICLWDAEGKLVRELKGHTAAVTALRLSPDGKRVVSGSLDQTVCIWDLESGKIQKTFPVRMPVQSVAFSRDEQCFAVCGSGSAISVFEMETGDLLQSFSEHSGDACQVAFAGDDALLVSVGSEGSILQRAVTARRSLVAHREKILEMAVARDGSLLATAGADRKLKFWTAQGKLLHEVPGLESTVGSLAIPGSGRIVAGALTSPEKKGTVCLWNAADGKRLQSTTLPSPVVSLSFTEDSNLAAACEDGVIRLLSLSGQLLGSMQCRERPKQIHVGKSGNVLSVESDHAVRSYLPTQKTVFTGHEGPSTAVEFTSDGSRVVSCGEDGFLRLWSLDQNREVARQFTGKKALRTLCISANDRLVYTGGDEGLVQAWELPPAEGIEFAGPTTVLRHAAGIDCIYAPPNGQTIFTGTRDHVVHAWSARDGKELTRYLGHEAPVTTLGGDAESGTLFSGGADNSLRVWSIAAVPETPPAVPASVRKPARTFAMTRTNDAALDQVRRQLDAARNEADRERLRQQLRQLQSDTGGGDTDRGTASQLPPHLSRLYDALRRSRSIQERQTIRDQILKDLHAGGVSNSVPGLSELERELQFARTDDERDSIRRRMNEARRIAESSGEGAKSTQARELASIPTDYQFDYQRFRPVQLAISEDGNTLVAAQSSMQLENDQHLKGFVQVWDVPTRILLRSWRDVQNSNVARLLMSPDERFIYAMPGVQMFDILQGDSQPVASGECFAIGRDQQMLAIGLVGKVLDSAATVEMRNLTTLSKTNERSDYEAMVSAIAFSPTGKALAICLRERARHKVALIDPISLRDVRVLEEWPFSKPWHKGGTKGLSHLIYSPDGLSLVGYGPYTDTEGAESARLTVWRGSGNGRVIKTEGWPGIEPDARMVFVKNSNVLVIETKRGVTLLDITKGQVIGQTDLVRVHWGRPVIAFSADGGWMASGDDGGQVALWDLDKRTGPYPFRAHSGPVVGIAFSTTGKLVTAGEENFIRVWKLPEKPGPPAKTGAPAKTTPIRGKRPR